MISVRVEYYSLLREQAGLREEIVQTEASDMAELFSELSKRHQFSLSRDRLRVAMNDTFCQWSDVLDEGATIVFIPPVAGG